MFVNIVRFAVVTIVMVAAILLSLGIFGVFSDEEIKDGLLKTLQLAGVVAIASGLIVLVSSKSNK